MPPNEPCVASPWAGAAGCSPGPLEHRDVHSGTRGGERAAAIYTLIETAKLNNVDPQAWLEDVLRRLPDHPARRLADLLPWNWQPRAGAANLAA